MLAPHHVIFTSLEGALLDSNSGSWEPAAEALAELARQHVALILVSRGTRAQIEPLRRKIEHAHPFITESGGGLFLPDGYFSMHLEGAPRTGRYFCVSFGRPYADAVAAVGEVAAQAGAEVVGYAQMTAREIARNTGRPLKDAELERQREFSERFFFVGEAEVAVARFVEIARAEKWQATPGQPFWELSSGNDVGRAVRHLMGLYRSSPRVRLSSVGIGSGAQDLPLLAAVDHAVLLPRRGRDLDPDAASRFPRTVPGDAPGPRGWNSAVLKVLGAEELRRR